MKLRNLFGVFVAATAAFAVAGPTCVVAESDVTVGAFVVRFAALRNPSNVDFDTAVKRLNAQGVALPTLDRNKVLTQADVVALGNAAGLHLTTSNPAAPVTPALADSFLRFARHELKGGGGSGSQSPLGGGNDQGQNNNNQGHVRSPSAPN